jgi:hypothetical protein
MEGEAKQRYDEDEVSSLSLNSEEDITTGAVLSAQAVLGNNASPSPAIVH